MREALASWHMGQVIRAYRHHPHHGVRPLSQELVASWLQLTQTQLSRAENGPPVKDLGKLTTGSDAAYPGAVPVVPAAQSGGGSSACHSSGQADAAVQFPEASEGPAVLDFRGRTATGARRVRCHGHAAFRAADLRLGGGHLYSTVVQYLQKALAPRLFGTAAAGPEVFTAASALTEMAGWMAHDAGRDKSAQQHFTRALDLATAGSDIQLRAHILASMSHLALHENQPRRAMQFARQGQAPSACSRPIPDSPPSC